jgi:hypothetical protein
MKRLAFALSYCIATFVLFGCGPMQMPMPVRMDDEGQKKVDQSWDEALTPVKRFDHPGMLDLFLVTQAYQIGVDKLTFHSEKKVALGTVVMEIEYDRLKPAEDRFDVKIIDPAGRLLRLEQYNRKEVEDAYKDLFVKPDAIRNSSNSAALTPQQQQELAALQARIDAVTALFPKDEKKAPEGEAKKP